MSDYYRYDKTFVSAALNGFNNTGAICWWNSLLQVMLRLPAFNKMLLWTKLQGKGDNVLSNTYINLLSAGDGDGVETPSTNFQPLHFASMTVLNAFSREAEKQKKRVRLDGQQSPIWGLGDFIELISDDIFTVFNNKYEKVVMCSKCDKQITLPDDKSTHISMYGVAKRGVPLTTKKEYEDYILMHTSEVESATCGHCKTETKKVMAVERLLMLREVIILAYDADRSHHKWYPQTLDFDSSDGPVLHYDLVGTIEHDGSWDIHSGGSGHYYARVKCRDGKFRTFNDSSVHVCESTPMNSTNLIFYALA